METVGDKAGVGKTIRKLRKWKGLTQARLAEAADLSDNFIGYVERGVKTPSLESLERIAKALAVRLHDLICTKPQDAVAKGQDGNGNGNGNGKELLIRKISNQLRCMDHRDLGVIHQLVKARKRWGKHR